VGNRPTFLAGLSQEDGTSGSLLALVTAVDLPVRGPGALPLRTRAAATAAALLRARSYWRRARGDISGALARRYFVCEPPPAVHIRSRVCIHRRATARVRRYGDRGRHRERQREKEKERDRERERQRKRETEKERLRKRERESSLQSYRAPSCRG